MVDVTKFYLYNVTDSCAVSNVLSSRVLSNEAHAAGCQFYCTHFVEYEVLYKKHSLPGPEKDELRRRFKSEQAKGNFAVYHLDIDDLQDIEILENRKRLGKGELSSIAYAKKTNLGFLTDDQRARSLASAVMEGSRVQTTPKLFGWLFFSGRLTDADKARVIDEHTQLGRPLARYFEETYWEAARCRLAANQESGVTRTPSA